MKARVTKRYAWREALLAVLLLSLCGTLLVMAAQTFVGGGVSNQPTALVTRDQAIRKLYDIIKPSTLDHSVMAFLSVTALDTGDVIHPWDQPGRQRTLTGPTWFGWIDDDPRAFFEHNTRYVLIDAVTGTADVRIEGWWPVVNGTSIFMSDAEWSNENIVVYSCLHAKTIGGTP